MNKIIQRFYTSSKRWKLEHLKDTRILSIETVPKDQKLHFPLVWLRDNCQCSQCFNSTSKSRILELQTNLKVQPIRVEIRERTVESGVKTDEIQGIIENKKLIDEAVKDKSAPELTNETYVKIQWEDKHESRFPIDWLLERNFSEDNRRKLDEIYKIKRLSWKSEQFERICSKFSFEDVLSDERILLKWLECLSTYGVAMVTDAGVEVGALKLLASRVGFLKKTQYGETFRVEAKPGTSNVAYLSSKLQLHTDLPYYEYKPGLNMLHCLVQAEASLQGQNQLTDCLAVIEHLRTNRPDVFETLSTTLVDWSDYGQDGGYSFANIHRAPVICLDSRGEVIRVNYSQPQRDSVFNVPIEVVEPWYAAMAEFTELLHHPRYLVELKLQPGEILTFDNIRLVHGRRGYDGERVLEGGYLDWDLVRSRVRVLKSELDRK